MKGKIVLSKWFWDYCKPKISLWKVTISVIFYKTQDNVQKLSDGDTPEKVSQERMCNFFSEDYEKIGFSF